MNTCNRSVKIASCRARASSHEIEPGGRTTDTGLPHNIAHRLDISNCAQDVPQGPKQAYFRHCKNSQKTTCNSFVTIRPQPAMWRPPAGAPGTRPTPADQVGGSATLTVPSLPLASSQWLSKRPIHRKGG